MESTFNHDRMYQRYYSPKINCLFYISVDGSWSKWNSWANCDVTCGGGTQKRSRSCSEPSPQYGGTFCEGDDSVERTCNKNHCPSMMFMLIRLLYIVLRYYNSSNMKLFSIDFLFNKIPLCLRTICE